MSVGEKRAESTCNACIDDRQKESDPTAFRGKTVESHLFATGEQSRNRGIGMSLGPQTENTRRRPATVPDQHTQAFRAFTAAWAERRPQMTAAVSCEPTM